MTRKARMVLAAAAVLAVLGVTAVRALLRAGHSGPGLGGTRLTERDLSRTEQIKLIDAHSPVPTPPEATDIRLTYQRFQDWRFRAEFRLPAGALERYVARLKPAPRNGVAAVPGRVRYRGRRIGAFEGSVAVEPGTRTVTVTHVSS